MEVFRHLAMGGLLQGAEIADHSETESGEGQRGANPGQGGAVERQRNAKPCQIGALAGESGLLVVLGSVGHLLSAVRLKRVFQCWGELTRKENGPGTAIPGPG